MTIYELRFFLTKCKEYDDVFYRSYAYKNYELLVSPDIKDEDLKSRILDDISLLPGIKETKNNLTPKFYTRAYKESIYPISELLVFFFASINSEWDIVKGEDIDTGEKHFYLESGEYIYDPSLAILTTQELYSKRYIKCEVIANDLIDNHLIANNNLYRYYSKGILALFFKNSKFSINLINRFKDEFSNNLQKQYEFEEEKIEDLLKSYSLDDFLKIRQIMTKKRVWELKSDRILAHPDIDEQILDEIEESTRSISGIMEGKYEDIKRVSYHKNTLRNCYVLSILYNLYDSSFTLVQGGFPYKRFSEFFPTKPFEEFYQHSWLERDDFVYDPAMRIVVPKKLYYLFFLKEDEYSKEDTKNILKRIGINFTYFRDFLDRKNVGNNESISYLFRPVDTREMYEEGTDLIQCFPDRD